VFLEAILVGTIFRLFFRVDYRYIRRREFNCSTYPTKLTDKCAITFIRYFKTVRFD